MPVRLSPASSPSGPQFSPLYQQIKVLLLQSLQASEWQPGDVIPSEMDLASRYRVSQGTVRKAIDELAADNILVRRQGRGTFVATHAEQQTRFRFLKLAADNGMLGVAQRQIIDCRRQRATADVARALNLRSGDAVLQLQRVLSFQDVATILEDIWLPGNPFKGLTAERLSTHPGPMYAMFESEFGVRMVRAEEKIRAVCPDAGQCSRLSVAPGTPLLSVQRIAYTYNDAPMELRHGLYRTDRHHYHHSLN